MLFFLKNPISFPDLYAMTDQAADRMNIPKLWDLMKKRGNKKKHNFDPTKERERMKKLYKTSIYDENGVRIVMNGDVNSDNENDDYDKEEKDFNEENENDDNDDDKDSETDDEKEEEEEEEEETDVVKERNQRIKDRNREEEELDVLKQRNKKLGRNVMIRTLSGKNCIIYIYDNTFIHLYMMPFHFHDEFIIQY